MTGHGDPSTDPPYTVRVFPQDEGSALWFRHPDRPTPWVRTVRTREGVEVGDSRTHAEMEGSVVLGALPAKPVPARVTLDFADTAEAERFAGFVRRDGCVYAYDGAVDPDPFDFKVAAVAVLPAKPVPAGEVSSRG